MKKATETLYLNEYTEKFSTEVKTQLDRILENIWLENVVIEVSNAKPRLINKVTKYLQNHDITVEIKQS